ncbi:putative enoyl-CoA hydratase echA8 [Novipirellula aureliae]|uniref:Putative enoyl-CoA hydratase echA8 n=1 Tax=Novipirellula aureliae TaxID=2527966 RepID=A0A5C6E8Y6_9BACT|nr:enoyl-CoA hydratase/isomerase family protein [Novipirellula aureliae]TWU45260.1 putative enoyl-CoA hydratase echA8 [Novipirellula aureliae]
MQYVDVKIHGKVATVLMNDSQRCNTLGPRMIEDLQTAFSDIHQENRVRAVVLSGAGDHFCAGIDLSVLEQIAKLPSSQAYSESFNAWQRFADLLEMILRFPKPIIAAVDGAAVGAGLGLALAADLMIVSTSASLSAEAVRRGLVGGATAALLSFRAGAATAAKMLLTGESIDADEAYRRGLCEKPVSSDQIWVAASDLATRLGHAPREAVQATKRVLNETIGETLLIQIAAGIADSATACSTDAAKEGVAAFLEKRPPNFL